MSSKLKLNKFNTVNLWKCQDYFNTCIVHCSRLEKIYLILLKINALTVLPRKYVTPNIDALLIFYSCYIINQEYFRKFFLNEKLCAGGLEDGLLFL